MLKCISLEFGHLQIMCVQNDSTHVKSATNKPRRDLRLLLAATR